MNAHRGNFISYNNTYQSRIHIRYLALLRPVTRLKINVTGKHYFFIKLKLENNFFYFAFVNVTEHTFHDIYIVYRPYVLIRY